MPLYLWSRGDRVVKSVDAVTALTSGWLDGPVRVFPTRAFEHYMVAGIQRRGYINRLTVLESIVHDLAAESVKLHMFSPIRIAQFLSRPSKPVANADKINWPYVEMLQVLGQTPPELVAGEDYRISEIEAWQKSLPAWRAESRAPMSGL